MRIRTLLPVLLTPVLFSCDGLFDSERRPPAGVGAASGDAQTGEVGSELPQPLVVAVRDARERPVSGAEVVWKLPSGKGETVTATSTSDRDGRASVRWTLPTVAGEHAATATVGALPAATFRATAAPGPVERVAFADSARSVVALDSVRLAPVSLDRYGNPAPGPALTWESGDTVVASVSAAGVLLARAPGETRVTARSGTTSASLRVVVLPRVVRVQVGIPEGAVLVGSTTSLSVRLEDAGFTAVTGRAPVWSSSDTTVATVSQTGVVRGVRPGTASIGAAIDGVAGSSAVRVVSGVASVALVSPPELVYRGHSVRFGASVTGTGGFPLGPGLVRWSSSDVTVATVDSTGVVTGVGTGRAVIRAEAGGFSDSAQVRVGAMRFARLDVGDYNPCGVTTEGEAFCWGVNIDGAVGNGVLFGTSSFPSYYTFSPNRVGRLEGVAVGEWYSCALSPAGAAFCWGRLEGTQRLCGPPGMRGASMYVCSAVPVLRSAGPYASLAAGGYGTCAIRTDGALACWRGAEPEGATVALRSVTVGAAHACGLTAAGEAYCWGDDRYGQLGRGTAGPVTREMRPVVGGRVFRSLSAGSLHTCGVTTAGEAYCWGWAALGQLGGGTADSVAHPTPARVAGSATYASVSAGSSHSCALTSDGTAQCWGKADGGVLGTGSTAGQAGCGDGRSTCAPAEVAGGHRWRTLEAGGISTCGLTTDGIAYCWGMLPGDGSSERTAAPVRVVGQL